MAEQLNEVIDWSCFPDDAFRLTQMCFIRRSESDYSTLCLLWPRPYREESWAEPLPEFWQVWTERHSNTVWKRQRKINGAGKKDALITQSFKNYKVWINSLCSLLCCHLKKTDWSAFKSFYTNNIDFSLYNKCNYVVLFC